MKISKNARKNVKKQVYYCSSCGGEVIMKSVFKNGKLKHYAQCTNIACKKIKRKPSLFK